MGVNRREFCKIAGAALLGVAGAPKAFARREADESEPLSASRWGMAVDLAKCREQEDCRACVDACHAVHNVPDFTADSRYPRHAIKWIWKETYEHAFPEQQHEFLARRLHTNRLPVFCNHCDNPPCARVCPTRATWKRRDGIVMMDWHRCIGCRYCIAACPYGSRSFNWRDPRPFVKKFSAGFPTRTKGVVEKCTFCNEKLAVGEPPACVAACKARALHFGDLDEAGSEIRAILDQRFSIRRKPGLGTKPEVFYTGLDQR